MLFGTQKNEVSIHGPTWINLKNLMLSLKSQLQKITYFMTQFVWNVQNRQCIEIELVSALGWGDAGGKVGEKLLIGVGFLDGGQSVQKLDCVMY